jgi:hypothetical protein
MSRREDKRIAQDGNRSDREVQQIREANRLALHAENERRRLEREDKR